MAENYYPISLNGAGTGFSVINAGTAPAPCVLTLIPRVNQVLITIEGLSKDPITVTNVSANDVIIINGEERTFTINGNSAWDKFSGWQFPRLEPGANEILISNASAMEMEVAYDVRYI